MMSRREDRQVLFSELKQTGEAAGLQTEFYDTQAAFLSKIFGKSAATAKWGEKEVREFKTLTHPEHLGRAFKVLVQSRTNS